MFRLSKDAKDYLKSTLTDFYSEYKNMHYSDDFGSDADPYRAELKKIRAEIKNMKAAGELKGEALDNILAKHDVLIRQWHSAAREAKIIQNMDPVMRNLYKAMKK